MNFKLFFFEKNSIFYLELLYSNVCLTFNTTGVLVKSVNFEIVQFFFWFVLLTLLIFDLKLLFAEQFQILENFFCK